MKSENSPFQLHCNKVTSNLWLAAWPCGWPPWPSLHPWHWPWLLLHGQPLQGHARWRAKARSEQTVQEFRVSYSQWWGRGFSSLYNSDIFKFLWSNIYLKIKKLTKEQADRYTHKHTFFWSGNYLKNMNCISGIGETPYTWTPFCISLFYDLY